MNKGRTGAVAVALGALLVGAGPASAGELLKKNVSAASAADRSCTQGKLTGGAGYAQETVTMPAAGSVVAKLVAASGDWDVAILEADSGRVVAGSASRGSREVAGGFAVAGQRLVIQACRLTGSATSAGLSVQSTAISTTNVPTTRLVRVSTPTAARERQLTGLGLDVTEHGGAGFLEVVLHGPADAAKLAANNFAYTVQVPNLALQARQDRAADRSFAGTAAAATGFPSGRTTYRRLFDYSEDLKRLAREHPDLVRPITLNHQTYEGRTVEGVEIATNPNARDGRPVFLQMGVHHAREWPSGEHAMEWAYELITRYRQGDARARRLVAATRTIVVPIVNPDGFNASREAGELYLRGDGASDDADGDGAGHRSRVHPRGGRPPERVPAQELPLPGRRRGELRAARHGHRRPGRRPEPQLRRVLGRPGRGRDQPADPDVPGPGPFSEPESRNVRELVSSRQVTTLITNHTFSGLVLRPPGLGGAGHDRRRGASTRRSATGWPARTGTRASTATKLYDTTGTTEDWSYNATGGLGLHVRDRRPRLPPAVRGDGGRVERLPPRDATGGGQPGGVLPRPGEHGRRDQALGAGPGRRPPGPCCG